MPCLVFYFRPRESSGERFNADFTADLKVTRTVLWMSQIAKYSHLVGPEDDQVCLSGSRWHRLQTMTIVKIKYHLNRLEIRLGIAVRLHFYWASYDLDKEPGQSRQSGLMNLATLKIRGQIWLQKLLQGLLRKPGHQQVGAGPEVHHGASWKEKQHMYLKDIYLNAWLILFDFWQFKCCLRPLK